MVFQMRYCENQWLLHIVQTIYNLRCLLKVNLRGTQVYGNELIDVHRQHRVTRYRLLEKLGSGH